MKKAQVSIEFFLIISVIVAFAVLLHSLTSSETNKARQLAQASQTRSFVDAAAFLANEAWLSGNNSFFVKEFFVPRNADCLYFDAAEGRVYCNLFTDVAEGSVNASVFAPSLDLSGCPAPLQAGWYLVNASAYLQEEQKVVLGCKKLD